MNRQPSAAANPLSSAALSLPSTVAAVVSIGGRLAGAALFVALAFDQSYDRTQVFAPLVAAAVLVSCLPLGRLAMWAAGLGSGMVFFAGTVFTHLEAGVLALCCGLIAGLGTLAWSVHKTGGAWPAALAFLAGVTPVVAAMVAIFFIVPG